MRIARIIILGIVMFLFSGCNQGLHYINTGYNFEHVREYQPDRYFSVDSLSLDDYRNIVQQYSKRFGLPIYSGKRDEVCKIYNETGRDGGQEIIWGIPHYIWGYATDFEYSTIYNQGADYILIGFSHHCGIYIF